MMKIRQFCLYVILLLLFINQTVMASEKTEKKYFGVGATVKEIESGIYDVLTKGEKTGEGFIFTPELNGLGKKPVITVDLKGQGKVFLKVEETDARGSFIKESGVDMIPLTKDWKTHTFTVNLSDRTTQMDVMVLTSKMEKINFQFKNVNIEPTK